MSLLIDCPSCKRQLRVPDDFLGRSVRCPTCGEKFLAPEAPAASPPPAVETAEAAEPVASAAPAPPLDVALKLELDDPAPAAAPPPARESRPAQEGPRRRPREGQRDDEEDDWDRRRRRRRRRDFEPCPRCDEDVRRGAVVCPFCGLDLEEQGDGYTRRARVRRDAEPHRGGTVQGLGIASLVLAIFYILPISLPLGIAAWVMGRRDLRKMEDGEMDPDGRKKTKDGWLCGLVGTVLTIVYTLILVGIISTVIMGERSRTSASRQMNSPTPAKVHPPANWVPPEPDFSVRGPAGQQTFIRRGETKTVTLTVDRQANFRGRLTVRVDDDTLGEDIKVDPKDKVDVRPGQTQARFSITAKPDAALGVRIIEFIGEDDNGNAHRTQVQIQVIR